MNADKRTIARADGRVQKYYRNLAHLLTRVIISLLTFVLNVDHEKTKTVYRIYTYNQINIKHKKILIYFDIIDCKTSIKLSSSIK